VAPIRVLVEALAIGFGIASAAIVLTREVPTSYAATSPNLALLDLAAGLGLIVSGLIVARMVQPASTGVLAVLLGVVWLCPDWVGWADGPAVVRSLAMLAVPFLPPLLLHLAVAATAAEVTSRSGTMLKISYVGAAVLSLSLALFRDPFRDVFCWSNCTVNVFLVWPASGLFDVLPAVLGVFALLVAIAAVAIAVRGLAVATPAARRDRYPLLVPVGFASVAEAAYLIGLWVHPAEDPSDPMFRTLFVARALALVAVAVGLVWTLVRQQRTRAAIARLAEDLGAAPEPGTLRSVLARSLGDPELEVVYPQPGSQRYVDADGRAVALPAPPRVATPIVRGGESIAIVLHGRGLHGPRVLEREIGAAARVAVDNERLRAGVLTHLNELRASRSRIVHTADAARQRIERDLHDGAQQRLLTLSYQLRLAHLAAETGRDTESAGILAGAGEEVRATLAELRDIAHGIHPVILTEAGLTPALAALARTAPLPVELHALPEERFPEAVERAAYIVVAAGIAAASDAGRSYVDVHLTRTDRTLLVLVTGAEGALSVSLADRVGALGGRISASDGDLRAEVPCG
jgi:signal transduction histidine kinase